MLNKISGSSTPIRTSSVNSREQAANCHVTSRSCNHCPSSMSRDTVLWSRYLDNWSRGLLRIPAEEWSRNLQSWVTGEPDPGPGHQIDHSPHTSPQTVLFYNWSHIFLCFMIFGASYSLYYNRERGKAYSACGFVSICGDNSFLLRALHGASIVWQVIDCVSRLILKTELVVSDHFPPGVFPLLFDSDRESNEIQKV